ncbi:MAG TPA: DUF6624 domain-containing protein [Christiangramia sp.]|nr:DUF6624 domain-containing protein [Christiangramia sp.]
MKKIILTAVVLIFSLNTIFSQDIKEYQELIDKAWNLYKAEDYKASALKYSEAFVALGNKGYTTDRYNAACSYALASVPDSSFVQLFKIAEKGNYSNYDHISNDPDLKSLYGDDRWDKVLGLVKANKEKAEANLDKELVAILDNIYQEDQGLRRQISEVEAEYGRDSDEMKAHWKKIQEKDSINLIKVQEILDSRGWLGSDVVGPRGNSTLFLVIQHADLETQEKYLPMMREAVAKGNASASSLALLEDRVALRQGKRQIYGSQIGRHPDGEFYISPLQDPLNVDKRRAEVGLGTLQDYVSGWEIQWNAEEYQENLPELEARLEERKKH